MIEINLLPPESRKKESRFKGIDLANLNLQNFSVTNILVGLIVTLAAIHVILFATGSYGKSRLDSSTKKYTKLLPQKKEYDSLKSQVDTITKKVAAIDELMVKRFSWARNLDALSDCMIPGIWLNSLSYEEKMIERKVTQEAPAGKGKREAAGPGTEKVLQRYLVLTGYASSMGEQGAAVIGKFIKSMKDSRNFYSNFSSIELGSIITERIENQEVMSFRVTCLFKD